MALSMEKVLEVKIKGFESALMTLEDDLTALLPDPFEIEAQMQVVRYKYETMDETNVKIIEKLVTDGKDQEILVEEEQRAKHYRKLQIAEVKVSKKIQDLNPVDPVPSARPDALRIALPQKKLPQFGGNVREWLTFWAAFQQIHDDGGLTDAEKFQYLLQCLTVNSNARKLIDSFPVNGRNYSAAVDALKGHYGRENMLVKVYVRDLLQLVIQNANDKGKVDLMELVPKLSSQIRNLEELGVTSDKCEDILYPVVESCLPDEVLQAWQRDTYYEEKLRPIMNFLSGEVTHKMDRTLARMDFGVTSTTLPVAPTEKKFKGKGNHNRENNAEIPTAAAMVNATDGYQAKTKMKKKCEFCELSHETHLCGKAKTTMTLEQRKSIIREKRLCYLCLKSGHTAQRCKTFVVCSVCTGKHYEMLCPNLQRNEQAPAPAANTMMVVRGHDNYTQQEGTDSYQQQHLPPPQQSMELRQTQPQQQSHTGQRTMWKHQEPTKYQQSTGMFSSITPGKGNVSLYTLTAIMESPVGQFRVRIFIDSGSQQSYVLDDMAKNCKLKCVGSQVLTHQVFGGVLTDPQTYPLYEVNLKSLDGLGTAKFTFNAKQRIAYQIAQPEPGPWMQELSRRGITLHGQEEAPNEIHILIGMDIIARIKTGGFVRLSPDLIAEETTLGWVVGGTQPLSKNRRISSTTTNTNMVISMMVADMKPEDLWSLEVLGITDEPTSQRKADLEEAALQHFKETVTQKPDGRYQVHLPWKSGHDKLKCNFSQAVSRLHSLTKDLQHTGFMQAYHDIIMNWKNQGIVEEISDQEDKFNGFYMPHRHVIKENSSTTPIRPVFNASAKAKGSISLNECLESGPNLLELIPGITLRFRRFQYGVISDIEKAFLQILVEEKHRVFLRFVWWEDTTCKQIKIFCHCRVAFGVTSSPFLLAATLRHHIESATEATTEFKKKLLQSLYVDNSVTSHPTQQQATEFKDESQRVLLPAKFNLRGWEFGPSTENKVVPVLGLLWNTGEDTISLCLDSTLKKINGPSTKRGLLSIVNSVFDPMGYVSPFTLTPKLLYQECCMLNINWDEPLPQKLTENLDKWKVQVPDLLKFKIPRWMSLTNEDDGLSIHCCCDGSKYAYATCIYLRSENESDVKVQLMAAKARVAPTKTKMSIPRMELLACLIGARLTRDVVSALDFQNIPTYFWTDSTTALAWIRHDKQWARFVANRVDEIRRLSHPQQWNHVPGELNPADLPSRGCTASKLLETRWWEGPEWMSQEKEFWPRSSTEINEEEVLTELKKSVVSAQAVSTEIDICQLLLRSSDYNKALRVVALIYRYMDRLRKRAAERKEVVGEKPGLEKRLDAITAEEIERAECGIVRVLQHSSFAGPDDSRLKSLDTFIDNNGILRVKSQLLFGNDTFNLRCPAVLPHDNDMVNLIIRKEHEENSHAGVQTLQAILRNRFWILKSRRTVSKVIHGCVSCRRYLAKKCEVPSPQLPLDRIKDTVAFDITGVDLAGPLFLRGGEKVWIVLFTDGVYRGVHLELTGTLSTEGFLMTFRRFVDRRGRPSVVFSDNGLNFVGANNLFQGINWNEVLKYAAVKRISWKFNPPSAAWWGGWWERLVGLVKTLLRRILGNRVVNYDQLHTILCDVEATMNKRPLTFISDCNGELMPICPSHHMKDNPTSGLPEADVVDSESLKKSVRICQQLRQQLRERFRKEYLGQLQHHASLKTITVKPGDVVLIGDDNKKRIDWPWGVVREVYPGRDGKVRTALVQTKDGSYLRAVQRLYILEVTESSEENPPASSSSSQEVLVEEKVQKTRSGRVVNKPDRLTFKKF